MENASMVGTEEEYMELPPGFRFHPTDEELITYYLSEKVHDSRFTATAIGEVDLNKCEPWDLPRRGKMGEKECYFFCVKDRKYPTGFRTNRATDAGYWKATGKDKEIYRGNKSLVGMKKTLVFYRGRAPKGTKTNWVMHEYRVEGSYSVPIAPRTIFKQNEWVICRVFEKSSGGKKAIVHHQRLLPPLTDSSSSSQKISSYLSDHVTCFSGRADDHHGTLQEEEEEMVFQRSSLPNNGDFEQHHEGLMMMMMVKKKKKKDSIRELSQGSSVSNPEMIQDGFDHQEHVGPVDLQCLWSY